jgi:hypothetical protein
MPSPRVGGEVSGERSRPVRSAAVTSLTAILAGLMNRRVYRRPNDPDVNVADVVAVAQSIINVGAIDQSYAYLIREAITYLDACGHSDVASRLRDVALRGADERTRAKLVKWRPAADVARALDAHFARRAQYEAAMRRNRLRIERSGGPLLGRTTSGRLVTWTPTTRTTPFHNRAPRAARRVIATRRARSTRTARTQRGDPDKPDEDPPQAGPLGPGRVDGAAQESPLRRWFITGRRLLAGSPLDVTGGGLVVFAPVIAPTPELCPAAMHAGDVDDEVPQRDRRPV